MDDGRQATPCLIKGARFVPSLRRFMWRADWEQEDMDKGEKISIMANEVIRRLSNVHHTIPRRSRTG